MKLRTLTFLVAAIGCAACGPTPDDPAADDPPTAPRAAVRPTELERHGDVRVDDYYWLRERENPEVVEYLEAENAYTAAVMAHTEDLQEKLFEEIVGRIKEDDQSVPVRKDGYWYYHRYDEGSEYAIYARKRGDLEAPEEIMLDANREAEGHEFFSVVGLRVSSGSDVLAYATDTVGRRKYTLRFRDLTSGEDLPDVIPEVTGNHAWAADNRTLFYTKQDPDTLRWHRIYRHVLGTDPAEDELVFEELDEEFNCYVYKTKSGAFLVIQSDQTLSSEVRAIWLL